MSTEPLPPALKELTPRQRQCVELLSHGLSYEAIGKRLYLTPNSVKTHLRLAYKALEVHGQAHAVRRCIERGIFEVERAS